MRWGEQLERGYQRGFSVWIEGIPFAFVERHQRAVETDLAVSAPAQRAISEGLVLSSDSEVSTDLDRQTGVARGRALDIRLDLDGISAAAKDMFRIASIRAPLDGDVTNPAATTIAMLQTSLLGTTGSGWIGREHVTWTGKTSGSITGVTRGVAGLPHWHTSNSASGYGFLTDRPVSWRGRFVEVWEHLLSPDGRMLEGTLGGGTYSGVLWRGFLDAQPEVKGRMVTLRALPIERIMQRQLGASTEGRILSRPFARRSTGFRPVTVLVTPADKLIVTRLSTGETVQVPFDLSGPTDVYQWAAKAMQDAQTAFPSLATLSVQVQPTLGSDGLPQQYLHVWTDNDFRVGASAWFLGEMASPFLTHPDIPHFGFVAPIITRDTVPLWVFVDVGLDVAGRPEAWPAAGYGLIDVGSDGGECVAWDAIDTTLIGEGIVGVRITQRGLAGTRRADIFGAGEDPTIAVLAGHIGTLEECLRTLLTSSGTGARGPFDTLPPGYGYGLPDEWLDFGEYPLSFDVCEALGEGESTAEQIIGGWIAARQRCIAQVRVGAGVVLRAVGTGVIDQAGLPELDAGDIVLGSAQAQGIVPTPNAVVFQRATFGDEVSIRVRDVPRVQAEGEQAWEFATPNIDQRTALSLGLNLMRLSDGQLAASCSVRPSFQPEVGDTARVVAEHPEFFDWRLGETGTDMLGRIVGWSDSLWSGETSRTLLLPAGAIASVALCPSAPVTARPSATEATIPAARAAGFQAGYVVAAYMPGDESTLKVDRIIASLTPSGSNVIVEFTAALNATDYPAGSWLTYGEAGFDPEQDRHAYYLGARWL
jgi:hypothetical protein